MKYEFSITKNPNPKKKPDPDTLRFGTEFTDHMFIMDYQEGEGKTKGYGGHEKEHQVETEIETSTAEFQGDQEA